MRTSLTTILLTPALIEIQANVPAIVHDAKNEFIGNSYATLDAIYGGIKSMLYEHKILVTQGINYDPSAINANYRGTVCTRLTHASGEWIEDDGVPIIIEPNKKKEETPMAVGSSITYARRQGLCAMIGVTTEDDDGQAASPGNDPKAKAEGTKDGAKNKTTLKGPIKSMATLKQACTSLLTDIEASSDLDTLAALMSADPTKRLVEQLESDLPAAWDKPKDKKTGFQGLKQSAKQREAELIMEDTR